MLATPQVSTFICAAVPAPPVTDIGFDGSVPVQFPGTDRFIPVILPPGPIVPTVTCTPPLPTKVRVLKVPYPVPATAIETVTAFITASPVAAGPEGGLEKVTLGYAV